jgi:membrane protease YdiL (CAAX protease family)
LGAEVAGGSEGAWPTTAAVAAFCLITPIIGLGEELLFRVYVQTRLTQVLRGQRVLPVFICAVLFALVHGYGAYHAFQVGAFGLVLGISYQANGKIPRLVIAHTLNNLVVGLFSLM